MIDTYMDTKQFTEHSYKMHKVSGLKSPFGVIKFEKYEWKLRIPQTLKNANRW